MNIHFPSSCDPSKFWWNCTSFLLWAIFVPMWICLILAIYNSTFLINYICNQITCLRKQKKELALPQFQSRCDPLKYKGKGVYLVIGSLIFNTLVFLYMQELHPLFMTFELMFQLLHHLKYVSSLYGN